MSRSYKNYPFVKCERSCKVGKKFANKKVRRFQGKIPNGSFYQKLYNSWDICDYCWSSTWREYQEWSRRWGYEDDYYEWYRTYKGK